MAYNPECVDCSTVDPVAPVIPPVQDPPGGGLPAGGEPGQVLSIDYDGNPVWVTGGGGGGSVTLYNTTGQSTTGGMTQKAITDALGEKVTAEAGKGLSTNDYTTTEKEKMASLENYDDTALAARVTTAEEDIDALETAVDGKQDTLVSGENLKTVNGESLLGSGNIEIQGGGSITVDDELDENSPNPVKNSALYVVFEGLRATAERLQERVVILEEKLAEYEAVRLTMVNEDAVESYDVLGKEAFGDPVTATLSVVSVDSTTPFYDNYVYLLDANGNAVAKSTTKFKFSDKLITFEARAGKKWGAEITNSSDQTHDGHPVTEMPEEYMKRIGFGDGEGEITTLYDYYNGFIYGTIYFGGDDAPDTTFFYNPYEGHISVTFGTDEYIKTADGERVKCCAA